MAIKRRATKSETKKTSNIEYENLAEGEHEGRVVYIADLGLHSNEYKGTAKDDVQKLALGIEVVGSDVLIDGEAKPRLLWAPCFNIYHELTSLGEELKVYKIFKPSAVEGEDADWDAVIGSPCNIVVKHEPKKGDDSVVYDTIASIMAVPAKYQDGVAAARITDGCTGDCDDANNPAQKALFGLAKWQFDQRIVEGTPKKDTSKPTPSEPPAEKVPEQAEELFDGDGGPTLEDNFDDDIPF